MFTLSLTAVKQIINSTELGWLIHYCVQIPSVSTHLRQLHKNWHKEAKLTDLDFPQSQM